MALGMYKQGQGFWTRLMTLVGVVVIFGWGAAWLAGQLSRLPAIKNAAGEVVIEPTYVQFVPAVLVLTVGVLLGLWLSYSRPASSEFLIATEGEMKKVNWSSRREILGSTWVVIGVALVLALTLFLVDLGLSRFFQMIKVLESGS